ncbi:IGR protein motif-domain-containing protein [Triangularia setosa]|uniref:Small ribosomal subunit protein mS41 n=1 Tax=Triangularia setosa TaxID=2587417 RepID=A0AAN6WCM7_9PEZI|nr:IGR protein motif-domain-containing protein [Podospora setosa]
MNSLRLHSAFGLLLRPTAAAPVGVSTTVHGLRAFSATTSSQSAQGPPSPAPKPKTWIPNPTPFVPNVQTFLTLIGRDLKSHASKFPSWDSLFSLNSDQLKELGLEPPRTRRYLLRWRDKFARGEYGIGGDLKHVKDGKAILKLVEKVKSPELRLRYVVNVPEGKEVEDLPLSQQVRAKGFKVKGIDRITGPHVLPLKGFSGRAAMIQVTEGMWEDKRGHKVDGGERRRAEVRFKRGVAERKARREAQGLY